MSYSDLSTNYFTDGGTANGQNPLISLEFQNLRIDGTLSAQNITGSGLNLQNLTCTNLKFTNSTGTNMAVTNLNSVSNITGTTVLTIVGGGTTILTSIANGTTNIGANGNQNINIGTSNNTTQNINIGNNNASVGTINIANNNANRAVNIGGPLITGTIYGGNLYSNGGVQGALTYPNGNFNLNFNDYTILMTGNAFVLPNSASGTNSAIFYIANIGSTSGSITTTSPDKFNGTGGTSVTLGAKSCIQFFSDAGKSGYWSFNI